MSIFADLVQASKKDRKALFQLSRAKFGSMSPDELSETIIRIFSLSMIYPKFEKAMTRCSLKIFHDWRRLELLRGGFNSDSDPREFLIQLQRHLHSRLDYIVELAKQPQRNLVFEVFGVQRISLDIFGPIFEFKYEVYGKAIEKSVSYLDLERCLIDWSLLMAIKDLGVDRNSFQSMKDHQQGGEPLLLSKKWAKILRWSKFVRAGLKEI